MTHSASTLPSDDLSQSPRDKRWLGVLLCAASSIATFALVDFLAVQTVSFVQDDILAMDTDGLADFSTSAGSPEED